jgi:hypothetical protein
MAVAAVEFAGDEVSVRWFAKVKNTDEHGATEGAPARIRHGGAKVRAVNGEND